VITCDYSGIAGSYDKWITGDAAYAPAAKFYLKHLENYKGIFAELGVGTGRIAVPLSLRNGVYVYGIDSCPEMLQQCRGRMVSESRLELICSDFTDFTLPRKADVIYMPFRTIGHILTKPGLEDLFKTVKRNLKQNGVFIFDHYMFSLSWAKKNNDVELLMYTDNEVRITDRYIYDFDNKLMHCEVASNKEVKICFDFRWIDVSEITDVCHNCGFLKISLFGDFNEDDWTPQSPNQIWVLGRRSS